MKKNRQIAFILAFFGVLLVLIAVMFWLDGLTPGIEMGAGAAIMNWITAAAGVILLVGALVFHIRKS